MIKARKFLIFLSLIAILLASCTEAAITSPVPGATQAAPTQGETPVSKTPAPTQETGGGEKPVVNSAIAALVKDLNVEADQVKIVAVEAVEWPNACLGAQKPDEMCAEVITPGYKIVLQAGGNTYEYHTNEDGSQVRRLDDASVGASTDVPTGTPSSGGQSETPDASLPAPAIAAREMLAKQLGLAVDQVQIIQVEKVQWPDGCLGIEKPGMMCTQIVVPGYRVILEAQGQQYEFRTDESGGMSVPAATPPAVTMPQIVGTAVAWEQTGPDGCKQVEVGTQNAKAGACGAALQEAALSTGRMNELAFLLSTYAPFSQETKAGKVEFNGVGSQVASEAEMRSIAEWAALVFAEAQAGQVDPAAGLAFNWHREGGIAGFCDDLAVYRSGWALPRSCKISQGQAQAAEDYRLSPDALEDLYTWLDTLASFDYEHKDASVADAMLVRLSLVGSGTQQATTAQQEEIAGFAAQVYANAVNR